MFKIFKFSIFEHLFEGFGLLAKPLDSGTVTICPKSALTEAYGGCTRVEFGPKEQKKLPSKATIGLYTGKESICQAKGPEGDDVTRARFYVIPYHVTLGSVGNLFLSFPFASYLKGSAGYFKVADT